MRNAKIFRKNKHESIRIVSKAQKSDYSQPLSSPIDHILFLQRTIGNKAVQRLIKNIRGPLSTVGGQIQAKLRIGQPGDKYEQEADRVADEVMRMPEPEVQRQPEEEEEEELIQTKELTGHDTEITPDLESRIQAIKGSGKLLPESVRAYFEPRFGYDFDQVRVHTDSQAAEAARAVNARAYTVGKDVVFGIGQYSPGASIGKRLLAHELTHVVQQTSPRPLGTNLGQDWKLPAADGCDPRSSIRCQPSPMSVPQMTIQRFEVQDCPAHLKGVFPYYPSLAGRMLGWALGYSYYTFMPTVQEAAWRHFKIAPQYQQYKDIWNRVIQVLHAMMQADTKAVYEIEPKQDPRHGWCWPRVIAVSLDHIHICPKWWYRPSSEIAAADLIHEWAHKWGPGVNRIIDTYCYETEYADMPATERVKQPDAYASYIYELWTNIPMNCYG